MFDTFKPLSVISFLFAFKLASDTTSIHEGAFMWLFHLYLKGSSAAGLDLRLRLKSISLSSMHRAVEQMLGTNPKVVFYLLQSYAIDDVIAENGGVLTR